MLIKGKELNQKQRDEVKRAFVNRHTVDHRARWAGSTQPTQTDRDWIESHAFHFVKDGSRLMANRNHCEPSYMAESIHSK